MSNNYDELGHEPNPDGEPEKWLDNQDVRLWLNVCSRTLYNWRSKGYIPYYRMGGRGKILFKEKELKFALAEGKIWKNKGKQ